MKKTILILSLALIATLVLVGCSSDGLALELSVDDAFEKYEDGVFLLDVRTYGEWDEAHVPNAVHIPLDELSNRLDEIPNDEDIVVMCRSGNRSLTATELLRENGYEFAQSMSGGIGQWAAKDLPLTFGE